MGIRAFISLALLVMMTSVLTADEIQIKGSDTIVRLTQRLAEVYGQQHPDSRIAVSGGGSGTGIAAIINGTTDIADVSRAMRDKEVQRAASHHANLSRVIIAVDAIAIVVHPSNPVHSLTLPQIASLFRGEVTNWKAFGGPDLPVTLYGRQSTSGTYGFLRDEVLKADYAPTMAALQGNAEIVEAVKADRSGVGYVALAFVRGPGIKALLLTRADGVMVDPLSREAVVSGKYPLTRPLYQYLNLTAHQEPVKAFVRFELGPGGQRLIEEEGFLPLTDAFKRENASAGF